MNTFPVRSANRLREEFQFFRQWLRQPGTVGAILPTGKALARSMAAHVPLDSDLPVLELGPGTGAVTKALLERGIAPERIVSVEYNRDFFDYLVRQYPGVNFVHGDAFDLAATLRDLPWKRFCTAVSGLPLLNFSRTQRGRFVADTLAVIEKGGPLVQFTYGPNPPALPEPDRFTVEATDWIVKNVPPARLFVYRDATRI